VVGWEVCCGVGWKEKEVTGGWFRRDSISFFLSWVSKTQLPESRVFVDGTRTICSICWFVETDAKNSKTLKINFKLEGSSGHGERSSEQEGYPA